MKDRPNRREFLKNSGVAALGAAALQMNGEAATAGPLAVAVGAMPQEYNKGLPTGKLGRLSVSRLFLGCNQVSGYAHARDLRYVPKLMREYQTDERVLHTWQLCEENGINTILSDPFERPVRLMKQYRQERRGNIQWISEVHPQKYQYEITLQDLKENLKVVLGNQPHAIYIQGAICDAFVHRGLVGVLGEALEAMKGSGLPSGLGAHSIETPKACLKAGIQPDFFMKTHHPDDYWSVTPREQRIEFNVDTRNTTNHDNIWDIKPEETRETMSRVKCPWIAFKVLAAGAIEPERAFRFAFQGGADFLCVGRFDFFVAQNAALAKKVLAGQLERSRPWQA